MSNHKVRQMLLSSVHEKKAIRKSKEKQKAKTRYKHKANRMWQVMNVERESLDLDVWNILV